MPESLAAKSSKGKDTVQAQEHSAEVARQSAPTSPSGIALAIQRSAGNQAFNHLLGQGFETSPSTSGIVQRKCACGNNTMTGGECEECGNKRRLGLQTKLAVNEPGDIYEQEADRVADQVMAAPAHPPVSAAPLSIRRFAGQSNWQMDEAPASVDQVLSSPGRPLEPALRQDMERRFGHDFSQVRVHNSAAAEQSAQDMNAQAYTVGHNIVFNAGRFAPGTNEGRRLLAHELTHVAQQSDAGGISAGRSNERSGLFPGSTSQHQPVVSATAPRMAQRSPDNPTREKPVKGQRSPQAKSKMVSFMVSFDKPLTRSEFMELADMTIYGRRVPGEWIGVPERLKVTDSPVKVLVPETTLRSVARSKIEDLPRHIQKFLTTDKGSGPVSLADLESVANAGYILAVNEVSEDELLLLEFQQEEAKSHGQPESEESDPVAWAEEFVRQRQEGAEKALKNREDIVSARIKLDSWSQDEKNGIKNVAEGFVDEQIMHMLLNRHGMFYHDLIAAFEFELKSITRAFLSQAQVALIRIEKTYLAGKNVGAEKERLRQTIEKISPALKQRDLAAKERDRRKYGDPFRLVLGVVAKDPRLAEAETNVQKKDEELERQATAAGLPVVSWEAFDSDAILAGDIERVRSNLGQFVSRAHSRIRTAQKKVEDVKTLYKADRMVELTKATVGIKKGSVYDDIISYRASKDLSDDSFWSTLWDIVTIALMFVPGNIGVILRVGAGLINTTKAMDEYAEGMGLHRADLASQGPSGLGVFLAVGGTLIDAQQMAKGFVKVLDAEAGAGSRLGARASTSVESTAVHEAEGTAVKAGDDIAKGAAGAGDEAAVTARETSATESLARETPPASSGAEVGPTGKVATTKATDPKVAEEMKKLGPVDVDTGLRLEGDDKLRKALADNNLAASALKKCTSPCFPEMNADQVERLEHILRGYKKTGDYDEALVKEFLADNRENLDGAIHALSGWNDSKGLDHFLQYAKQGGDIEKLAAKIDPKLVSAMQRRAHDVGVEFGRKEAIKDGLKGVGWENPIKQGGFDQGFDDIMVKGNIDTGEVFIVEYKGGMAGLSPGQMSLEWVKKNIKRLGEYGTSNGREMAEKLAKALKEGRLRGVVYSTPVVGLRETKKIGGILFYDAVGVRLPPAS